MSKVASYLRPTNPWTITETPPARQRCTTPDGRGYVWPYTPLEAQVERGRYCVILDGVTTGARYYDVKQVDIQERKVAS